MRSFASDNNSGVHPDIFAAMAEANVDHAVGYGDDRWTKEAHDLFRAHFGTDIEVAFTFSGTGANIIALALGTRSFNAIICARTSHINFDECGGPETFTGCKLVDIDSKDGKLNVENISQNLIGIGDPHHVQARVISLAQTNEMGLVYSAVELRAICDYAHEHGLYVHMDGARLSNAAAALGISLRQASRDLGLDVLSFGGTKNGMMFGEAVVVFNKELFGAVQFIRKQAAQLASKMRFISAQFIALLSNDLWLRNAKNANSMASVLARKAEALGIRLTHPVQANAVFAELPAAHVKALQERRFFYAWAESKSQVEVRWMTSFDTTESDIGEFVSVIANATRR